jgi:hypothetical protein
LTPLVSIPTTTIKQIRIIWMIMMWDSLVHNVGGNNSNTNNKDHHQQCYWIFVFITANVEYLGYYEPIRNRPRLMG